jgi:hypothetical protein
MDTGITALTILENASFGYFYALSYSCADDDSSTEGDVPPKVDVSDDSQVLEVPHMRGLSKSTMQALDLVTAPSGSCLGHQSVRPRHALYGSPRRA